MHRFIRIFFLYFLLLFLFEYEIKIGKSEINVITFKVTHIYTWTNTKDKVWNIERQFQRNNDYLK